MGYMDLSIGGSDEASDAFYVLSKQIVSYLKKEEKQITNCYNTDGIINVALILEALMKSEDFHFDQNVLEYLVKFVPRLEKYEAKYDDNQDGKKRLKSIIKKLRRHLEAANAL